MSVRRLNTLLEAVARDLREAEVITAPEVLRAIAAHLPAELKHGTKVKTATVHGSEVYVLAGHKDDLTWVIRALDQADGNGVAVRLSTHPGGVWNDAKADVAFRLRSKSELGRVATSAAKALAMAEARLRARRAQLGESAGDVRVAEKTQERVGDVAPGDYLVGKDGSPLLFERTTRYRGKFVIVLRDHRNKAMKLVLSGEDVKVFVATVIEGPWGKKHRGQVDAHGNRRWS